MDPATAHLKDNLNDRIGIETLTEICAIIPDGYWCNHDLNHDIGSCLP